MVQAVKPSWRKPAAIAAILLIIAVWALLVVSLAPIVGDWPVLVQAIFYLAAGLAWIVPLKPLLRWAETARWRDHSGRGH
ncbi:MAG: DUF2842 domain-containing protein [Sphingomonas sp.]|nr:DUF2842 domain-containing protein [Sphingomonas sp.]